MSNTRRQIRTRLPFTLLISAPGLCLLSNLYFSFSQVLASLEPKITHCTCCCFWGMAAPCTSPPLSLLNPCCYRFHMEISASKSIPESSWMCRSTDPAAQGGALSLCAALQAGATLSCPSDTSSCRDMPGDFQKAAVLVGEGRDAPAWPCLSLNLLCSLTVLLQELPGQGGAGPGPRPSSGCSPCSSWALQFPSLLPPVQPTPSSGQTGLCAMCTKLE